MRPLAQQLQKQRKLQHDTSVRSSRAEFHAETVQMLADGLETAVSVLCAPSLDGTWRLVGRKPPLTGGTPAQPPTAEEQQWVAASKLLQSSFDRAMASCWAALGFDTQPFRLGGVASPDSVAMQIADQVNELLKSTINGDSSGGSGSSGGSSRQGVAGGRRGGRGRAAEAAPAPSLSDSERVDWAMRLTTMLSDAVHLCVRVGWPLRGDGTEGSGSDGTSAAPAAGSGSTAAPPVEPAFVQYRLDQLALTLAGHYRLALEGEHGHRTLLSALHNECDAAGGESDGQAQEAGSGGSGGSTRSGNGAQGGGTDEGEEHGSSMSRQGSGGQEEEKEAGEEEGRSPRQQALWTLRVLLEAAALRLPPVDVAASADSLAAATCQAIEATARPGAGMHLVFSAVMYEDPDPTEAAGAANTADKSGAGAAAGDTATATGTVSAAGAAPAEPAEQPSAEPGAALEASGQQQPSAAGAAESACRQDYSTDPDQGILGDLDVAGCARALTWLMAALLESGEGGSLTPQQHSAALRTLLLLLRTAAKHALAAAQAVVDTPTAVISGEGFGGPMAAWLHNAAQLLAWAACAVALRARVWRNNSIGGLDEASE